MKTNQLAGAMLAMVVFNAAGAAEIKVLSAGALEPGVEVRAQSSSQPAQPLRR